VSIRKTIDGKQTVQESLLHRRHEIAYEETLKRIQPGWKVLEIGHGEGYGTHRIAEKADVIGIDIDPRIVEYASKKYGPELFRLYDGSHIPFDDNHFDAACMFQVIEHIVEDVAILREVRRVLKPGGILILTTPNRVMRVPYGEMPWNIEHIREYYPEELTAICKQAGFSKVEMLGIDASDDYRNVELARVAKARKLRRVDPFRLRRFIPDQMLYNIGRMIVKAGGRGDGLDVQGEFFVTDTDLYRSLDLLGIATK